MEVSIIGIDLAKRIFQVCGLNRAGKPVFNKKLRRSELLSFVARHRGAIVALESCGGSSYWGRRFRELGFQVKLIPPQFVKPFVKTNKSDFADAEAICEAAARPTMRFSSIKSVADQDLQALHRVRQRYVRMATALSNEIRGFLSERGIVLAQGRRALREWFSQLKQTDFPEVTMKFRGLLTDLFSELASLDEKIKAFDERIVVEAKENPVCAKLLDIPGVGPIIATAIVAAAGDPKTFKSARHFAAHFGLTPKHSGSGGKTVNLSISKRGNSYIRCMLVQGANAVMIHVKDPKNKSQDRLRSWAYKIKQRRGHYRAVVALANKMARIIFAMMVSLETFEHSKAAA
jgi:transposase